MKIKTVILILAVELLAIRAFGNSYMKGNYEEVGFGQKSFMVAYPNLELTPGDVIPEATRDTVCAKGYSKKMRGEVSKQDKIYVYYRYGLTYDSKHYQIDHFIPLSIGGSNKPENLWPQPIQNNAGFLEKQRVAQYLHEEVCADKINIKDAQEAVRKDWHHVYRHMKGLEE